MKHVIVLYLSLLPGPLCVDGNLLAPAEAPASEPGTVNPEPELAPAPPSAVPTGEVQSTPPAEGELLVLYHLLLCLELHNVNCQM